LSLIFLFFGTNDNIVARIALVNLKNVGNERFLNLFLCQQCRFGEKKETRRSKTTCFFLKKVKRI